MTSTNVTQERITIPGWGTYIYDSDIYTEHLTRTRASLLAEVLDRYPEERGDRTRYRRMLKIELAAILSEAATGARTNERENEARSADALLECGCPVGIVVDEGHQEGCAVRLKAAEAYLSGETTLDGYMPAAERPAAVVTNVSDLTVPMRAGLTDRYRVPAETARALRRRGLVVARGEAAFGGYQVELTEAGKRARDAVLAPLTERARVRNIRTGLVGRVVRLERSERCDVVVLRWDTWRTDTAGSPAYLEVVSDDVETGPDEVAFAECESNDNQRRRAAGVYVPLTDAGRRARVALARLGEQVQAEQPGPPRFVRGAATPGYEVDAVMPASVTYCGTQPTAQSHPHAYGFLRSAVLGQAAGRPFADPVAAVRHLDECLRLAGYSVPTMEG